MGETTQFQPLTRWDKITVVIYRMGIVFSTLLMTAGALFFYAGKQMNALNFLLPLLYVSVGLSVMFIHLYISRFHRGLKILYTVSVAALAILYMLAGGFDIVRFIGQTPPALILLIPLSGCLGFVTAKEAFCFRLYEGYILAMFMPAYLFIMATGLATIHLASLGLNITTAMLLLFTVRKVFQPLYYDIGDKSAYM